MQRIKIYTLAEFIAHGCALGVKCTKNINVICSLSAEKMCHVGDESIYRA